MDVWMDGECDRRGPQLWPPGAGGILGGAGEGECPSLSALWCQEEDTTGCNGWL